MFKIEYKQERNVDNKIVYVSLIPPRTARVVFTNKYKLFEYHKDLENIFREYFYTLDAFYYRIKQLELKISNDEMFGFQTAKMFLDVEEMRFNIFRKKDEKKFYVYEIASIINSLNRALCIVCFRASKANYIEAESFYHILSELQTKFYSVLENSYELHTKQSLKLFI